MFSLLVIRNSFIKVAEILQIIDSFAETNKGFNKELREA